jgi:hypothetical protein
LDSDTSLREATDVVAREKRYLPPTDAPAPEHARADPIETLAFAGEGLVKTHHATDRLESINANFDRMKAGIIDRRVVMTL